MSRFNRNTSLIPRSIEQEQILLVGAGAVGKQVAISLASMGAKNMEIFDFDKVDTTNISTQAFRVFDVGKNKAQVVSSMCKDLDYENDAKFVPYDEAWDPDATKPPTIIFSCADTMSCRQALFKYFKKCETAKAFFDTRILGESMYIFSIKKDEDAINFYEKTLFSDAEANEGRCTARTTIYTATIAANLAIHQFARFLRGVTMDKNRGYHMMESNFHRYQV